MWSRSGETLADGVWIGPDNKPSGSFEHMMMDFIELTPSEGKRYCLVIVCVFSKWIEVFLAAKQDAGTVAKVLLADIIPRWKIVCEDIVLNLFAALSYIHSQVKAVFPVPAATVQHHLKPKDWVLIKDHRRKHWKQ